ncbi:hypothetical protein NQ314_021024 [Rhamnusium bicolor]|uniref:Uncharacterized protein n=1 Tax=Rhamnusium bicolor TaxID=1586634 RepID=A0AAV8WJN6_9CUCU|nr:hypothetical protein NQ314_021024 [Rhamnusium bicolor]
MKRLVSISPAINYGWLHTKPFEIGKLRNLKYGNINFNRNMIIPLSLNIEFDWWLKNNMKKRGEKYFENTICIRDILRRIYFRLGGILQ